MYFNSIPDFLYPDFKEAGKYKLSKNIFRRIRIRDSFNAIYASSISYTIQDGETPDSIAFNEFGDGEWFWTILILNNITDMNTMWPMKSDELDRFIEKKYKDFENKPRHWETKQVTNSNGDVVLESGIIVELFQNRPEQNNVNYVPKINTSDIRYVSENAPRGSTTITLGSAENLRVGDQINLQANTRITQVNGNIITFNRPLEFNIFSGFAIKFSRNENWKYTYIDRIDTNGTTVTQTITSDNLLVITNREYEYQVNELKKQIKIPKKNYLNLLENELQNLMRYETTYKITEEGYRISEDP
jgi:hypothetical protein